MKSRILVTMMAALSLLISACSESSESVSEGKKVGESTDKPGKKVEKAEVVLGCGSCNIKVDGTQGCKASVVIDGKNYLVKGDKTPNAHNIGLCGTTGTAVVSGKVVDGAFVLASISDFKLKEKDAAEGTSEEEAATETTNTENTDADGTAEESKSE